MSKAWFSSSMFGSGTVRREDLFELMMRHRPLDKGDGSKERYAYIEWLGIYHAMRELPSADRPQGEWVRYMGDIWTCSACGESLMCDDIECNNYCPNCGADMKGADDEDA